MKLSNVLSKYLLANKQLDLPGLGSFFAENTSLPENATVRFEQKRIDGFDEAVVAYVSTETGKMKPLAASDLTSQLEDAIQFLNTGKPYLFNGIGTLLKKPDGNFSFISNIASVQTPKKEVPFTERNNVPQSYIDEKPTANQKTRKTSIIIILLLVAIAVAGGLWYLGPSKNELLPSDAATTIATADTSSIKDSTVTPATSSAGNTVATGAGYTYVLETAKEARATKRYNQLKKLNWPVALEKLDSLQYNIVMKLPIPASDTTRVKDSLSVMSGKKVVIRY